MNNNKYKSCMDELRFSDDFSEKAMQAAKNNAANTKGSRRARKYVIGAAAACVCLAATLLVVPILNNNDAQPNANAENLQQTDSQKSKDQANSFGIVRAYAASPDSHRSAIALPCAALMATDSEAPFPAASNENLPIITFENDKADSVSGVDLVVSGDEVESVTYTCKNHEIFYEDSRNWRTTSGDLTWSEYTVLIGKEKLPSDAPAIDDIIAVLEQMQFSDSSTERDAIRSLVDRIYSQEIADIAEDGGNVDEFLDEKLKEPIDFSKYNIEYSYEDYADKAAILDDIQPVYIVKITNPANPAVAPVTSKSVTVRSGEYVTWCLDNKSTVEIIGSGKPSVDFSTYTDEISVTLTYKNGESKTQLWLVAISDDGNLVVSNGSDVSAA